MLRIALALLTILATAALVAAVQTAEAAIVLAGGLLAIVLAAWPRDEKGVGRSAIDRDKGEPGVRQIVESLAEPVLFVEDNRVRIANAAARALLGNHILGEDVRLAIRHPAAAARLNATSPDGIVELPGLGGRDQRISMHIATLGSGKRIVELVDQTGSHAAERARTDFVANSSHELRTPLAALIGFIETLSDDDAADDAEVRRRFLGVMMKEARRMQRLIDDLISLSRIEAEKHSLPDTEVDLSALIREVAGEVGAPLALALDDAVRIQGDRTQLSQLLHNLIGNAIKYGRPPVEVALSRVARGARLTVGDRGEGIAPEHLPRLTERFYRVDASRSRAQGGTGLGLAIAKHIVERHRGRIDIASTQGEGTTVTVNLPTIAASIVTETSSK
jgi:two-component system, OmpR family, phosphate regulon sensor histidine kinase PhoR